MRFDRGMPYEILDVVLSEALRVTKVASDAVRNPDIWRGRPFGPPPLLPLITSLFVH
jgi:hypothetical protein